MRYKLLVSDFDGTMCSSDCKIPKENIEAVNDLILKGGKILIATGRLFKAVYPHLITLGIKKGEVICHQGAAVFDIETKRAIDTIGVNIDEAIEVLEYVENIDCLIPLIFYEDIACYEEFHPYVDNYAKLMQTPTRILNKKLSVFLKEERPIFTKLLIVCTDKEKDDYYLDFIKKNYSKEIKYNRAHEMLYEAVNKNATKGQALINYINKNNIKLEEVIAIGDAENDISMLSIVGLSVATGNAVQSVKNISKIVTVKSNEGAVSKIIKDYML